MSNVNENKSLDVNKINERTRTKALRELLKAYGITGSCLSVDDYEAYLKDGYLVVLAPRSDTEFRSGILVKDSKKITALQMKCPSGKEEKVVIHDGDEFLSFTRDYLPSKGIDESSIGEVAFIKTNERPFMSCVDYGTIDDGNLCCNLQYVYYEEQQQDQCGLVYFIKGGIPKHGAVVDSSKPRAYRALYRINNGNINFFTEYLDHPVNGDTYVEGGCYQVFNRALFEISTSFDPETRTKKVFGGLDFDSIKSAILYTGRTFLDGENEHYTLRVLKTKEGILVNYDHNNWNEKPVLSYMFTIPRLSLTEINSAEVELLIDEIQSRFPNDTFISIVIGELNRFNEEIKRKKEHSSKIDDTSLSPRILNKMPFADICDASDSFFKVAREEFEIATAFTDEQMQK